MACASHGALRVRHLAARAAQAAGACRLREIRHDNLCRPLSKPVSLGAGGIAVMCGLAGIVAKDLDRAMVQRMGDSLRHRGPDDEGLWCDLEVGVGLAHRRLSIIDLSAAGHQPMESADGRFVLIYNGEIYNHAALRSELEAAGGGPGGNGWHGHSDTETLLATIAHWGLATALAKSGGMFALALWDRKARRLQLARDRFGAKPLYS